MWISNVDAVVDIPSSCGLSFMIDPCAMVSLLLEHGHVDANLKNTTGSRALDIVHELEMIDFVVFSRSTSFKRGSEEI